MADNIVDDSGEIAIVDLKDGYEDVLRAVNGEAGHSEERVKQEGRRTRNPEGQEENYQ